MYIVDNEITVTWVLGPTDTPLTANDFDISFVPSTLKGTYTDGGIVNYVAPTSTTAGSLQYLFTPLAAGKYVLRLAVGSNLAYTRENKKYFWVFQESPTSQPVTKTLGAVSYPAPVFSYPVQYSSGLALDEIYGFGYDGGDIVLIGAYDVGNAYYGLFQTDPEFSYLTPLTKTVDLPSWHGSGSVHLAYIQYSSALGLWVIVSKSGQSWWTDDLVTFNYIPLGPSWSATASKPIGLWWDAGLELFYMTGTGFVRPMLVSATGKGWTDQATLEVLGGSHPTRLQAPHRIDLGATKIHFYPQWEEYLYKTVDTGGSTGWTKTNNNGVIGGSGGTWTLNHVASDGNVIAVCAFGSISISADVTNHPDGWGPNGNSNTGFTETAWGWPTVAGDIHVAMHLPQYDRPWIFFSDAHGWYDTDIMPSGGVSAPTVTKCTAEPWATLNAEFDGPDAIEPKVNLHHSSTSIYYTGYDDEGVWGKNGFGLIMDRYLNGGSNKDYIVMQRPS